ncbi:MAG: M36 family metallopeptidase [Candidatus Riflebacteria bacterium]|nr:M36 family metallopeptidase [Candidatus Riflebacteria bacterium]
MKRLSVLVIFSLCLLCTTGFAIDLHTYKAIDGLVADEKLAEGVDLMIVSPDERLFSLRGNLSEPLITDGSTEAENFIRNHASLFNLPAQIDSDCIRLVKLAQKDTVRHISFQMMVNNFPVRDSMIDIHVGKNGVIELINGSFPTIQKVQNQLAITHDQAVSAAMAAIGYAIVSGDKQAELQILPVGNDGLLVYCVRLSSDNPIGDFEMLIDAEDGKEISRQNLMVYTGIGMVYTSSPISGPVSKEDLPHLSSHSLKGEFADVTNADGESAVAEDDIHLYAPDNTHFDEVNVYYNINRIHNFFSKLGCTEMNRPLKAVVHFGDKFDNAAYRPFEDVIIFGDGDLRNDYAKEESICWHEYSHAVLQGIVSLFYFSESGAMNEGQADYFACSLSNDPKYGEWSVAKMGRPFERNLENSLHYPEDIKGEVHADGQIWSGALWDLRKALGADVADVLIHKSHYYLKSGSPRFLMGVNAILTADKNLFDGAHLKDISSVFKKRGIDKISWGGAASQRGVDKNSLAGISLMQKASKSPWNGIYSKQDIANILKFRREHQE